jgi:hypothetical protein
LTVTRPEPLVDLSVRISPPVAWGLRGALAFMWIYTALVSAGLPSQSGALHLLARCGFEGRWGVAALAVSCMLNLLLGVQTLRRPSPALYAVQCVVVLGYGVTAAVNMPELMLDHCGPLVKNVPVLMAVVLLWLAQPGEARPRGGQPKRSAITPAAITPVPNARCNPKRSFSSPVPSSAANSTEVSRSAATEATGARVIAHSAMP